MIEKRARILENYHLGEMMRINAGRLGERCGKAAIELLSSRLAEALESPEDDRYTYIWRRAIEDHAQNDEDKSYRSVMVDALRDATLAFAITRHADVEEVVGKLLISEYPTLVRIGIFICGERYFDLDSVFWHSCKNEWFSESAYWHEVFWLIKKSFRYFSLAQRANFFDLINASLIHRNGVGEKSMLEIHKRDLLYPAFGLGDSRIDIEFNKLIERYGQPGEHVDFHIYSTG